MKIIAVMSPKGGIGKTTTSDAIAYMLGEEQEKRVLILDGDPQGDTSKTFEAYEPEGTGMSELLERHVSVGGSFRRAENQKQQIQILTELTCKSKYQIIGILLRNGEKVPKSIENQLYKRLDALDAQIFECEMEYKEIVTALTGENRRKEHGNRIQRHGRTEQEQQGRS